MNKNGLVQVYILGDIAQALKQRAVEVQESTTTVALGFLSEHTGIPVASTKRRRRPRKRLRLDRRPMTIHIPHEMERRLVQEGIARNCTLSHLVCWIMAGKLDVPFNRKSRAMKCNMALPSKMRLGVLKHFKETWPEQRAARPDLRKYQYLRECVALFKAAWAKHLTSDFLDTPKPTRWNE